MHFLPSLRIVSNTAFNRSQNVAVSGCTVLCLRVTCGVPVYLTENLNCHNRPFSIFFSPLLNRKNELEGCTLKKDISSSGTLRMSTISKPAHSHSSVLRLSDYDCIGFDLDNTVCEYNISSSVEMEYDVLANFLVKEKGYDPYYLLKPLDKNSIDFLQKGLLVDFARGNILRIGENGIICKASHGTRFLSNKEIIDAYGKDRKWEVTSEFCKNTLTTWNGPLSERMRALLDYFDMPASLAFARIIDSLDHKLGRPADIYNVWPDVLSGLHNMYSRDNFARGEGGYFQEIKSNPQRFIKQCNPLVLEWLKKIKESKMTFLITGSNCDFASLTAETCLGKNWRSLFDVVICYARKPGFFSGCRPFIELVEFKETNPIDGSDLELGRMYSQGNWQELYQLFGRKLGKKEPRCLYVGDNLVQDVYTPSEYTKCDTVAVVEELSIESIAKPYGDPNSLPSEAMLSSQCWGSYFFDENEHVNTVWGGIINNYSKVCIPTLAVLAQYSINHEFSTFCKGPKDGYFPICPSFAQVKKKFDAV